MWVLFLYALLMLCSFVSVSVSLCDPPDQASLLSFSSHLSPPLNWSSSSSSSTSDCCSWEGVACNAVSGRVTQLSLPNKTLNGTLPPSILNLSRLSLLNLSRNRISGPLPSGFFDSLPALQILDLSFNDFTGEFPSLPLNNSLQALNISSNQFSGGIPGSIFQSGRRLATFNASDNSFSGLIPSPLCDVSNPNSSLLISSLDFSNNNFSGEVPAGLGSCSKLETFRAGFNSLTGKLPDDMFGATALQELSLFVNQLTGPISNGITNMTNLRILALYSNNFTGPIPADIGKLEQLEQLLLHVNNLTGSLPPSLKDCTSLRKLYLRVNKLGGNITEFDFSPLKRLTTLDLGNNNFTGNFPRSLYSCTALTAIRFATNGLKGQILPDIVNLQSLSFISVSNNSLENVTGALSILTGCKSLTTVILTKNFLHEPMPRDWVLADPNGFQKLQVLALGGCNLRGEVPGWLQRFTSLEVLDLSQNQFSGSIPGWLGDMANLFYIDLSSNLLLGGFPIEFTALTGLKSGEPSYHVNQTFLELPVFVMPNNVSNQQYNQLSNLPPAIYLYNNSLSGPIPREIGQLKSIHVLELNHNNFSGTIPDEISSLSNLEILDLSNNEFTGVIPASLKNLHFLSFFSVAYNNLQGMIPAGGQFDTFPDSSYVGNPGLCGRPLSDCSNQSGSSGQEGRSRRSNRKLVLGLVLGICFAVFLVVFPFAFWVASKSRIIPRRDSDNNEMDIMSINSNQGASSEFDRDSSLVIVFRDNLNDMKDLTISEILKATDNFNQANIIGCGAFGLVYKATLANGTKLAVKKLSGDMGLMEKEFKAEVEVLSNARHENLVTLQGYCIHEGSRLLIYSYMENGSLDYWLHEKSDGPAHLSWPMRLKIAQGASRGVAYMHQICQPHIVHRDIKSSNILLDGKFEAHVADFGLSRLILPYHTHVTTELVGTLGYIPPEYAHSWVATLRGDMYSFGVVMLELLTGKRPVEITKPKESRELVGWVQEMRKEGKQNEIFDPLLQGKGFEDQMVQVLDVACLCVSSNPFKRPTIQDVVDWLENVGQ
ncbi:tyrosine-sulfated glycopeptide receptor 1 [Punica granatum]|uniref:non-specific serine/threonine protein kinase n=1 Tax=Punica granatum TaxID=22663 RepID=A0A218W6W7_PUNGR|nr:tyrosine-sulfated glycopeptide receptor 1 [Punica granatum]OWM68376.1 hypothetical protein CDL15_Pgr004858 [Punica granatum]